MAPRKPPGPGLKHGEVTIMTAARLPKSLRAALNREAKRRKVSRSEVIVVELTKLAEGWESHRKRLAAAK